MSEAKRKTGLGRGLNSLLGDVVRALPADNDAPASGIRLLPVDALAPHPGQPRRTFDEWAMNELADSLRIHGMIQPIIVRPHSHGFQIVAGERRWRAARRAQMLEVPVIVREYDDAATLEVALLENIQREDLNAIEEAQAYQRLVADFGHTQEALGRIVHKSRSHVANLLRLLDLPPTVQGMIVAGELTMGHGKVLLSTPDAERIAEQIVQRNLSVRDTEKLVRGHQFLPRAATADRGRDADSVALERQLSDLLGLPVRIAHRGNKGTLTLDYTTLDQLDMLCQRLSGEG